MSDQMPEEDVQRLEEILKDPEADIVPFIDYLNMDDGVGDDIVPPNHQDNHNNYDQGQQR